MLPAALVDWTIVPLAVFGLFFAGVVKGATGLGYASCALPFLVPVVGLQLAMVVVLAPTVATNLGVALGAGHFRETSRRFAQFYLAILPGIISGFALLSYCDQEWACRFLGVSVIAYVVFAFNQPKLELSGVYAHWLQLPTGFVSGLITGLTGSQVVPLLPYMMSLGLDPNRLVQAVNLSVLLSSSILAATMVLGGAVPWPMLIVSLIAILPALIGVTIGAIWRRHMAPEKFRTAVLVVLFGLGLSLAAR